MDPTEPRQQTGSPSSDQEGETFGLIILSLTEALSLGGLLGNGIMLWLLGSTVYRNPCAIYLLDTACADLIFLGCHMVAIVPDLLPGQSGIPGFVHTSLAALRFFCYLVGLALLAAVSVEQCLAALLPARYPCRRPRHLATAVCALSWALSLLLHLLLSGACSQPFGEPGRPLCRAAWLAAAALLALLSAAVGVPSLLLLRAERGPPRPAPGAFPRLVLLSALLFLFGDLPFGIYWLARSLRWRAPRRFHALSLLAVGLDRAAKPVVCFCLGSARGRRLREPLRLVLQRALGEDAELEAGRETPAGASWRKRPKPWGQGEAAGGQRGPRGAACLGEESWGQRRELARSGARGALEISWSLLPEGALGNCTLGSPGKGARTGPDRDYVF